MPQHEITKQQTATHKKKKIAKKNRKSQFTRIIEQNAHKAKLR